MLNYMYKNVLINTHIEKAFKPEFLLFNCKCKNKYSRKGYNSILCLKDLRQYMDWCFTGFPVKRMNSIGGMGKEQWDDKVCGAWQHVTVGLNGRRRGGVGSQLQRSLSQGIRTSAPACALMGGLPSLTGVQNTCSLLAQSSGNRNHKAHIEAWQVEKIEILGKGTLHAKFLDFLKRHILRMVSGQWPELRWR